LFQLELLLSPKKGISHADATVEVAKIVAAAISCNVFIVEIPIMFKFVQQIKKIVSCAFGLYDQ